MDVAVDLSDSTGERVGLLGGTFDPVHNGHLEAASVAKSKCRLDSVVFIPAASIRQFI